MKRNRFLFHFKLSGINMYIYCCDRADNFLLITNQKELRLFYNQKENCQYDYSPLKSKGKLKPSCLRYSLFYREIPC